LHIGAGALQQEPGSSPPPVVSLRCLRMGPAVRRQITRVCPEPLLELVVAPGEVLGVSPQPRCLVGLPSRLLALRARTSVLASLQPCRGIEELMADRTTSLAKLGHGCSWSRGPERKHPLPRKEKGRGRKPTMRTRNEGKRRKQISFSSSRRRN